MSVSCSKLEPLQQLGGFPPAPFNQPKRHNQQRASGQLLVRCSSPLCNYFPEGRGASLAGPPVNPSLKTEVLLLQHSLLTGVTHLTWGEIQVLSSRLEHCNPHDQLPRWLALRFPPTRLHGRGSIGTGMDGVEGVDMVDPNLGCILFFASSCCWGLSPSEKDGVVFLPFAFQNMCVCSMVLKGHYFTIYCTYLFSFSEGATTSLRR